MKLKIGYTTEDLVNEIRAALPSVPLLKISISDNEVEILNADGSELTTTEQDTVKTWIKNNMVR